MANRNFDFKVNTENFEVGVDTAASRGYFEHHVEGDAIGGELWFQAIPASISGINRKLELTDYDGVFELPKEVAKALRDGGFIVSKDFD